MTNKYIKELRRSIKAPKGHKIVVVDSAQVENRMLYWAAKDEEHLNDYRNKVDQYNKLATKIYGFQVDRKGKHPTEGLVGKTGTLGLGYGMGGPKFQHTLAVGQMGPPVYLELAEAKHAVNVYRVDNPKICGKNGFWNFMERMLATMVSGQEYDWRGVCTFHPEGVDLPNGLTLWYPKLQAKHNPWTGQLCEFSYLQHRGNIRSHLYGGKFTENLIQALARILVGEQTLKLIDKYRMVMMSHDESVFCVPTRQAKRCLKDALEAFRTPSSWCPDIPLDAEGSIADNYGDCK